MTPHLYQRVCHRIRYASSNDDGFTLIEAVIAFVLLVIVSAASVTAMVTSIKSSNSTQDRVTAANLAQQDLERARALQYPNYPASVAAHKVVVGSKNFTVRRSVPTTCPALWTPGQPTSMTVTTTVTWPGSSGSVSVATEIAC